MAAGRCRIRHRSRPTIGAWWMSFEMIIIKTIFNNCGGRSDAHQSISPSVQKPSRSSFSSGFTLLEILLAVTILGVISVVVSLTFSAAVSAWQKGTKMADSMHHGDFVVDQLVMGLRSAYYPEANGSEYGFWHEDDGDGENARDEICWVKLGGSLVGRNSRFAETPHRVRFLIEDDEDGDSAAAVKAWRLQGQVEDFDPDEIEPIFLSKRIVGFNCRMAWEMKDDEIDWMDEWEDDLTNKLPTVVEITLYVDPAQEGEDPIELKRIIGLRLGVLSWK